jgi:hypothetical protein
VHWLDSLWLVLPRDRLFANGWGDCDRVMELAAPFLVPDEAQPLLIQWSMPSTAGGVQQRLGTARAPCALAPSGVERLSVLRLTPANGKIRGRCIVPPSWNDPDFSMRSRLFAPLVVQGVELWLLEGAFFGKRRPLGQIGVGIRSVAELLAMGLCDLTELRGMVAAARLEAPHAPVVLAGFSMAGQFSAQAASTLVWEIPVVAMSPSDSPVAVFVEGPLSRTVDWAALGAGGRERLIPLLDRFGIRTLVPPPSKKRVLLATRRDGIVPPSAFERVAKHWEVQPRWLDSGHLGAFMFNRAALRSAVLEVLG